MQHPRGRLLFVTLAALASSAVLIAARPPMTGAVWSRGDDLALAVAWAVAVAASAWLFVATGVCVVALGVGRPRLAGRLASALPVGIRRLVEVAIVAACVAVPALPASAAGPAPAATVVIDQPVLRPIAPSRPVATPTTVSPPVPRSLPAAIEPHAEPPAEPAPSIPARGVPAGHVLVRAGDNLWLIARAALTGRSGVRPTEHEIAGYWRAVIAANRATLRSGDPSLIFPGELIALPPLR